jgi:thiol-disulfide isomerase/thioredoxin
MHRILNSFKIAPRGLVLCLFAALAFACSRSCQAAEDGTNSVPETAKPTARVELRGLVTEIQEALKAGKTNAAMLGEELKKFDALLAKYKDEKTDEVAQILFMKAKLYSEVFDDLPKAIELVQQLKKDFPETKMGQEADEIVASLKQQAEVGKIQKQLVEGSVFPDFDEKDLDGKPLSVGGLKGKVVLIDFWATWCGPCRNELPNVIETYQKHKSEGFAIIGVSLDQSEEKLKDFIAEKKMTWPQYFDGKGWGNKLAGKYGIQGIPATFLLDGQGKIIGRDLRGEELEAAVTKAVAKRAGS